MRSRRLGAALKRLRLNALLDQEHAAEAVACSTAKISRIESGAVSARVGDVRMLLDLYEVEDAEERKLLEKLARDSNKRGWWLDFETDQPMRDILGDFLSLESDATYIRTWQPLLVPGLLQTPDYTRALTDASPDVVEDAAADLVVKVRQERRRIFEENGARFAAVIWEPAITGPMPNPVVHREQLAHLIRMAKQPNVTIQVLPINEWTAARASPSFVGLSYANETSPEVVVLDTVSNCVILEDHDVMAGYVHAFDALRSAALTPTKSVAFIRTIMNSITAGNEES
ncbi:MULTISPECIES: helix-turn-helix domain-containing protein [unclassified Streptomyces]|uniref:helix-turn-helix domain-containing protein n=1 Tax=unclassified Streptomyces TaxID=2593676 RepID=UPI00224CD5B5|nr:MULTISPECIES: helix-turn-helix transcriptional regulator [unclassified Streptomyces]WSP55053.1 helix-turn-helix domain-containing protein [Streptomyces sp. NBC_01241]WSU24206.1 helix-turn-helix domain-containing protein [Streptomyces sp. NBC_01108]MCX4786730.1 helix-turn-helix domain-containing protein [Streptomyces sp. NBC_01221]WSJ38804.1 helix-turn-helix domain-containing protein [Streptomyces sp. NBC_01321]WSP65100.1 helix-turn-helix domain-containing protein [Streptomyces sp. NBC_01240